MRRVIDLLKRFRRDEGGAFLVLFAVLALVLIATSGAVVDFTYMQTARSRAQTALDSAALALQTRITIDSNATLVSKAQTLLQQRLNDQLDHRDRQHGDGRHHCRQAQPAGVRSRCRRPSCSWWVSRPLRRTCNRK